MKTGTDPRVGCVVVVIGPMPPPLHGMAAVTRHVTDELSKTCSTHATNTSPGSLERGLVYHATKFSRVLRGVGTLARRAPTRRKTLYLPSDARWGIAYTSLFALLGRLMRYRVVLHHHSYRYIDRNDRRMALLTGLAGPHAIHVLLSAEMARAFVGRYPLARHTAVLSNAGWVTPHEPVARSSGTPFRIAHLGNLGEEKGLDIVLELFRRFRAEHSDCSLMLAGPPVTGRDRRLIADAGSEFGAALDYRGPVDADAKRRFFDDADVFVLPSRSEAEPLVVLEAMAQAVPVIAFGVGCVPGMLTHGTGRAVSADENFVDAALTVLRSWTADPTELATAGRRSHERLATLRAEAASQLRAFVTRIGAEN